MVRRLLSLPISLLVWAGLSWSGRQGPGATRREALSALKTSALHQRRADNERRLRIIKSAEAADRLAQENLWIEEILRERGEPAEHHGQT